jgi:hypothetical protein
VVKYKGGIIEKNRRKQDGKRIQNKDIHRGKGLPQYSHSHIPQSRKKHV